MRLTHARSLPSTSALASCAALTLASCAARTVTLDFENSKVGSAPSAWLAAETNPGSDEKSSRWTVHRDGDQQYVTVHTNNTGHTYNLLFAPVQSGRDVEIAIRARAETGVEDQGGGIVWRAADAKNYYITRWNPLEDNLRAYKVVDGKRTQLASVEIAFEKGWHQLDVRAVGTKIEVGFNGKTVLSLEDSTFSDAGRVGLWTKADAVTSFDDLLYVGR